MRKRRVKDYQDEVFLNANSADVNDEDLSNFARDDTLHQIKCEDRKEHRLILKSKDLNDIRQLWMQESETKDKFFQFLSFPLSAIMFYEEDLNFINEMDPPIILRMDATGSVVRKPDNFECKRIFLYDIIARHSVEIVRLATMVTSEHDMESIEIFLKKFRYFVEKTLHKWPFATAITVDWSWASIHSILKEWNIMKIIDYLCVLR